MRVARVPVFASAPRPVAPFSSYRAVRNYTKSTFVTTSTASPGSGFIYRMIDAAMMLTANNVPVVVTSAAESLSGGQL